MREWLKEIRISKNKTQAEVAESAGISANYYCYIETGARGKPLRQPTAKKIANVLGFDWIQFYKDDEPQKAR